ncbi:MAG: hypothetical protein H0T07_02445, partial [Actinobacteria bacterium]|nr:hypothetical protein [Actinomycetota bacterium]
MKGLALVLIGIFLLNLLVAVWLVILALLDRYHQREAAREIEDLERSFALASEGSDVLATRRLGGGRRSTAVRDRIRSPHRAIVGRGSPGLPRLVSRAGVSLGLAALTLCVAIAVPDLGGRQGVTSADGPSSVVFP